MKLKLPLGVFVWKVQVTETITHEIEVIGRDEAEAENSALHFKVQGDIKREAKILKRLKKRYL